MKQACIVDCQKSIRRVEHCNDTDKYGEWRNAVSYNPLNVDAIIASNI